MLNRQYLHTDTERERTRAQEGWSPAGLRAQALSRPRHASVPSRPLQPFSAARSLRRETRSLESCPLLFSLRYSTRVYRNGTVHIICALVLQLQREKRSQALDFTKKGGLYNFSSALDSRYLLALNIGLAKSVVS